MALDSDCLARGALDLAECRNCLVEQAHQFLRLYRLKPTDQLLLRPQDNGTATRYGVGIAAAGFAWSGKAHIAYKREWPTWTPPADMIERHPELNVHRYGMKPGPDNPMGPRALYIHQGNTDTLYRIHGNSDERTIGQAISSGCVRLLPQDIIHLYAQVRSGSPLVVI